MAKSLTVFNNVELYMTRVSGEKVTVIWSGEGRMSEQMFNQIKNDTYSANGNLITGYKNTTKEIEAPKMDSYDKAYMDSIAVSEMSSMGE